MTKSRGIRRAKGTRDAWAAAHQGLHVCQCGCGTVINVRPEHIHDGVPLYIHGHNRRGKRQPLPQRMLCECGCGVLAGPGKQFVSGHNGRGVQRSPETKAKLREAHLGERSHRFGKRPPNFIGRTVMKQGYVLIHAPDHPYAGKSSRKVMEHRLVVEAHLRVTEPDSPFLVEINGVKYLRRDVEVHHRNEVKGDNRIENLHPMTKAEHARHHESFADVVKQRQVDRQIWDAGVASQAHLCRCGCGKAIDVRPHHYHQGIPAFIPGHNRRKR